MPHWMAHRIALRPAAPTGAHLLRVIAQTRMLLLAAAAHPPLPRLAAACAGRALGVRAQLPHPHGWRQHGGSITQAGPGNVRRACGGGLLSACLRQLAMLSLPPCRHRCTHLAAPTCATSPGPAEQLGGGSVRQHRPRVAGGAAAAAHPRRPADRRGAAAHPGAGVCHPGHRRRHHRGAAHQQQQRLVLGLRHRLPGMLFLRTNAPSL